MNLNRRAHVAVLFLLIWLCCTAVAAGAIYLVESSDRSLAAALRSDGVVTVARVTGTQPQNHNSVEYSYVVAGKRYEGGYFGDGPEGDASQLAVGQLIHVVYDSANPTRSCYCDVSTLSRGASVASDLVTAAFLTSVISVIITLMIRRRRHKAATA
jgi:uncharacterized protein DUF3592